MTRQAHSLRWFGVGIASTIFTVASGEVASAMLKPAGGGWGPRILILAGLLAFISVVTNALSVGFGIGAWLSERKFCPWMLISAALLAGVVYALIGMRFAA